MRIGLVALPLALGPMLAACGAEPQPAPTPTASTTDAGPRTLVAAALRNIPLGPRIAGPGGPETTTVLTAADGTVLGQMVSYVACPAPEGSEDDMAEADADPAPGQVTPPEGECDTAAQAEGALYTYVHRIGLGRPDMEAPDPAAPVPQTMVFRMTRPAAGFANVIGYDVEQAREALGDDADIKVQLDNGQLVWRVVGGDGWRDGETLTFFWQSTQPPEGSAKAYELQMDSLTASANAPWPGDRDAADAVAGGM
ncbi:hypothetical protein [Aurantiacibacter spongiae]|uniref:Lipoprotein n=1 Tax=Aurantiacibacter spongiae TaxID=2488860 RepID=A0A3N5DMJ9_9SPHN|nr:hypothetical protein [Aurantiacibacter spongiae]RPF70221.1 hypothetical protein EG799_00190 [Aurantiacibacter spongiae]